MSGFNFGSTGNTPSPFGSAGGSGGSGGSIFGQTPASSAPASSSSGLFGQPAASTATAPSTGMFGGGTTSGGSGLFGGGSSTGGSSLFGGNKPASEGGSGTSTPSIFGKSNGPTQTPMFGGANTGGTTSTQTGGLFSAANTGGGGFSFGTAQKKDEGSKPTENTTPAQGNSSFSNLGGASSSAPLGSTTPAPNKPSFSFGTSTTPAGPPPAEPPKSLFGTTPAPASSGTSLFGSASKPAESTQKPASSNLFGGSSTPNAGGLFGGAKPAAPASSPSLFGAVSSTPSAPSTTAPASTPSLFGAKPAGNPASTASITPAPAPAPSTTSLFGGTNKATPASSAPSQPSSGLFSGLGGATSTSTATSSTPAAAPSLFVGLGQSNTTSTAPATTSSTSTTAPGPASTPSLFGSKPAETTSTPAATTSATANSSNPTAPSSTPSLFGSKPAETPSTTAAPANAPLGASTAGPAPQLSRLKNKTMDEIITRWASDLSKYQKEFQEQAARVATWDRLLVDNGEKIQKLYLSAIDSERASNEVERQLSSVESQQDELAAWLDRYEGDVDQLFEQYQMTDDLKGPDQERERTYKLAEKLTDRLDEMGKDLTGMIEAINEASSTLNKSNKTDDPLSNIVRVLNQHLQQLQWIDQNATLLQKKVAAAQKMGQSMSSSGYGGLENDAADDFYRSFMSSRR